VGPKTSSAAIMVPLQRASRPRSSPTHHGPYCPSPLLMHSLCMQNQVTWCAPFAAIDNTSPVLEGVDPHLRLGVELPATHSTAASPTRQTRHATNFSPVHKSPQHNRE
jgi:hypothetical protein